MLLAIFAVRCLNNVESYPTSHLRLQPATALHLRFAAMALPARQIPDDPGVAKAAAQVPRLEQTAQDGRVFLKPKCESQT